MRSLFLKPSTNYPTFSGLFDDMLKSMEADSTRFPATNSGLALTNISETENGFQVDLQVPGFNKEQISLKVENGILQVSGEIKKEESKETGNFTRKEFSFSSFTRSFTLPKNVISDKIEAKYENGILHVFIPKQELEQKPQAIEIKVA